VEDRGKMSGRKHIKGSRLSSITCTMGRISCQGVSTAAVRVVVGAGICQPAPDLLR
jgi:hypothetical protein